MRVRIMSADVAFHRGPFDRPLRLSSGVITEITEARARVTVEADGGAVATGRGAIYLSDLWAWPDPAFPPAERDAALRAYCERLVREIAARTGDASAHPLEVGLRLHRSVSDEADTVLPPLARLVCASPFDAALHDAAGIAAGRSAFALYDEDMPAPEADPLFPETGAIAAVRRMLLSSPTPRLDSLLVVGKGETLGDWADWVTKKGYRGFKLKVGGVDPEEDAARVAGLYREARALGVPSPRLSVDSNCAAPNAAAVLRFLETLEAADGEAYAALESVEQPTARDIRAHAFDWRTVAARKPVLLDEALTDFAVLREAEAQNWNGLAVKTCRGHSFSLVTAAWAFERGWTLAMMDLTNPGYAAVHSALFGSRLPGVTAIEMNAPQYTPAANAEWLPRLTDLLAPVRGGTHIVPSPAPPGLGSAL